MRSSVVVLRVGKFCISLYLIIFLIGGGRICGGEALSWIGIDVHHHHDLHHGECDHHRDDGHDHDNDCDEHNEHDAPSTPGDCCENALVLFDADQPKKLSLPQSPMDEIELSFAFNLLSIPEIHRAETARRNWLHPPPPGLLMPASGEMLIAHQRFNL